MRPRTFHQVVTHCAMRGVVIEQMGLRQMVLKFGCLRWTLRLKADGLWHPSN